MVAGVKRVIKNFYMWTPTRFLFSNRFINIFYGVFIWFTLLQASKLDSIFNQCNCCSMIEYLVLFTIVGNVLQKINIGNDL